ncbi:MAG TPA: hypothetical protein DD401_02365 [Prevotella sp.]|nr:hypothetical protein [Prevotella sp.]
MEKNVTLSASGQVEVNLQGLATSLQSTASRVSRAALAPLEWLRKYYSAVCEKQLSLRQTGTLIGTQLAFIATVFPVDAPWLARFGCGAWLLFSLHRCKRFLS